MPAATSFDPVKDLPHPLLDTDEHSDFTRNFREMQKRSKRPYSLTKVLKSYCKTPPKLDGFELEVDQELKALNCARSPVGRLVPVEVLSTLRRDLTIGGYPQVVQTTVGDKVIPFLRAKTVCGQLGATIIEGLTNGNVQLDKGASGGLMERGTANFVAGLGNSAYQGILEAGHVVRTIVSAPGDQVEIRDGYVSVTATPI